MPARPSVSVVVPFLGSASALSTLVESLGTLRLGPDDEVIVADNGGHPAFHRCGPVRVEPASGTRTPGFARNRGAAGAAGEWLVFIDSDTEPSPDLLTRYFASAPEPSTAVLAGGISDTVPAGGEPPGLAARYAVSVGHLADGATAARPAFPYAQTANCAVRRSAFVVVGGFDERARAGEDADLCLRLAAAGWGLERRPEARVAHRARATLGASLRQLARHGSGAAWCNRRFPGSFPPPTPGRFVARLGRSAATALAAGARGDREGSALAALEIARALAFELGRLTPNLRARG